MPRLSQNTKQALDIKLTFMLEIKPEKEQFSAKHDFFPSFYRVHFGLLLGWEYEFVCQDLGTVKQCVYVK